MFPISDNLDQDHNYYGEPPRDFHYDKVKRIIIRSELAQDVRATALRLLYRMPENSVTPAVDIINGDTVEFSWWKPDMHQERIFVVDSNTTLIDDLNIHAPYVGDFGFHNFIDVFNGVDQSGEECEMYSLKEGSPRGYLWFRRAWRNTYMSLSCEIQMARGMMQHAQSAGIVGEELNGTILQYRVYKEMARRMMRVLEQVKLTRPHLRIQ
jgi:hypothetical protein